MSDESMSETSEQDHPHLCPRCDDTWLHADGECDANGDLFNLDRNRNLANCPQCQED